MFSQFSRNTVVLLGLILALALGLRLYRIGTYGIYFDEKSTLLISQSVVLEGYNQKDVFSKTYFTPAEFWKPKTFNDFMEANIRGDIGNSPVYYGMLWVWLKIFGLSDASLRMPSVIFGTLVVWLLFVFVRRHFRNVVRNDTSSFFGLSTIDTLALTSAAIAAIEPFFVASSHIARNYQMTIFLTILSTYVFLIIMERVQPPKSTSDASTTGPRYKEGGLLPLYVAYGLLFILSTLSHYLAVVVFLCHGLYAALFLRKLHAWVALGVTGIIGLVPIVLWFLFGGGKYTFFTLKNQADLYRKIALTNPTGSEFGTILPATIPNIAKRAIPIFSDLFIFINGLGPALGGLKNSLLAFTIGSIATFIIHKYRNVANPPTWVYVALPVLFLIGIPIYSVVPLRLLVLSAAIPFVYLISRYVVETIKTHQKRLLILLVLLAFLPTLFLLFMAWRSGHTFGITQRYSSVSFAYVCIFVAMGLIQLTRIRWWFSAPIAVILLIQSGFLVQLLGDIYADKAPKYTFFDKPRIANPYWSSAQKLKELYAPGDTILYPNKERKIYSEAIDKTYSPVTLIDAQMVNVYLPKDAQYIQRVDPNEPDRIVLVKGNSGQKITIFDFKGTTYRYGG
ncbi:hypothetical protein IC229_28350 [Spirosoma sp. BT702]|uniref:Glycosyltransferase RgtA/B/C/D-like domain-containing protein n=1 Tax=Spirosoma profusum TaxID=2771354 RepID=A0A926Y5H9_9BACT|nr:glycosyltransferase family 39 protein [Spirosoma profusum]MBD2704586.1 hypothetical protein [Spirosoma profusum]